MEKPSPAIIAEAAALGSRAGHVLIGSADRQGRPHLAAAGRIEVAGPDRIIVWSWFCPRTMANLQDNPEVAVVAWDAAAGIGHQLLGRVESMEETGFLDGYVPALEDADLPQIERRLVITVKRATGFGRTAHSDREE
ncbi:MAG: pyridoxamine 5'-phosphate oxidase family protein [Desulfobacteraceae bacterium]|nr:pyridoxamine 5'-phosphate oxidase family protein [Desulfobacteraceae bacterium]